jgi:hypothetical protein
MALDGSRSAALAADGDPVAELFHQLREMIPIGVEFRGVSADVRVDAVHGSNGRARPVAAL